MGDYNYLVVYPTFEINTGVWCFISLVNHWIHDLQNRPEVLRFRGIYVNRSSKIMKQYRAYTVELYTNIVYSSTVVCIKVIFECFALFFK